MTVETSSASVIKSTFEEILARDGMLTYRIQGVSMEPMLRQGRDLVTVRAAKPGERFKEGDVVLYYRRPDCKHTLHRIVGVGLGGYTILGDNCVAYEWDIPFGDVLGVLVSFVRDGRPCTVHDPEYLTYVRRLRRGEAGRIRRRRVVSQVKSALKRTFPNLATHWREWRSQA